MGYITVFGLCWVAFVVGILTTGHALDPERFPLNWVDLIGWGFFVAALISWEIASHD